MPTPRRTGDATEQSPLINGGAAAPAADDGLDRESQQDGRLAVTFFNPSLTPGRDSDVWAVRALACSWHVAKVTLMSSECLLLLLLSDAPTASAPRGGG